MSQPSRLKLLLFLDTDHLSGPARLALDFCVEARRLDHEVLVLGLVRGPRPMPTPFSQAFAAAGVPVRLLHERFRFDPGVVGQFRAVLDAWRPDLFQSHGYKGSLLARLAQRRGIPWQAVFHGFTWENPLVRLYHALDVRWLRRADEVVAVSRPFARVLAGRGIAPQRLRWVPNAIDEAALRASRSGEDLRAAWLGLAAGEASLVGVIGRFSPEKAPDHFLRAFSRAAGRAPRLRAVMVGEGPELDTCRRLAATLPGAERVIFAGFRADVASIYEALDFLAIPSRSEGLPTVLLEAMLLGVPVASTLVGGVPDLVRDGQTALLAPIGDEAALADAFVRLAEDKPLRWRLAQAAQGLARARLSVQGRTATLIEHAQALRAGRPLPNVDWD